MGRYHGPGTGSDSAAAIVLDKNGHAYVTGVSAGEGGDTDFATVKYDSDGNQLWNARYHGPTNGLDAAIAIALDGEGNLHVTGWSAAGGALHDYATVKYDSDGNQQWVARYRGPGNGDDRAAAIALDSAGHAYVTGWSWGVGTNYDYATVKYDSDGYQLWDILYQGTGDNRAGAIALDTAGNVYVTGSSQGACTDYNYVTVKYSQQ